MLLTHGNLISTIKCSYSDLLYSAYQFVARRASRRFYKVFLSWNLVLGKN